MMLEQREKLDKLDKNLAKEQKLRLDQEALLRAHTDQLAHISKQIQFMYRGVIFSSLITIGLVVLLASKGIL